MELASKYFYPALGFILTVGFGFWLSRRGKPYNGLLFNFHKLIALGTVILVGVEVYRLFKVFDLPASIILSASFVAVSILALFASGALMSANKGQYRWMKLIHNIAPFSLLISIGYFVYLLPQV
jgi:hypothetical protein